MILEELSFKSPKTKDFVSVLKNLNIDGEKSFCYNQKDDNLLSSRGI